ncbi:MAG: GGDEF domain-containing protein [Clostridium sp.]|nr:GGDEF domain-containing protein [Clostridium sp.]
MCDLRDRFKFIYTLIFFISIIIIVFAIKGKGNFNIDFFNDDIVNCENQWDVQKTPDNKALTVHVVDEQMIKNKFLFFRSNNKEVDVFIDEEKIYNYADDAVLFILREWTWHEVQIKEEYLGKKIKIINNCEQCKCGVDEIKLSKSKMSVLAYVIWDDIPSVIVSILFLFISILLITVYLLSLKIMKNDKMLYLSISSILVSIVFIINSKAVRLVFNNYDILNLVSCEIIMVIPMAIILHFLDDKNNKLPNTIKVIPILNFILGNILHLVEFFKLSDVILLTKILLIFETVAFLMYFFEKVIKGIKNRKKANIAFIIISALMIVDFVKNCSVEYTYYFYFFKIGIFLYIVSLVYDVFKETLDLFILGKNIEVYKKLAYNDILTGVLNRLAFENDMEDIAKDNHRSKNVLLIMIDINDLKYINDSKGHEHGDKYIVDNINYINSNIDSLGTIYRTGGDEFVIISSNNNREILEYKFRIMQKNMLKEDNDINFAYGIAAFDSRIEDTIYDTLKRADKNMYINKNRIKSLELDWQ